MSRKGFVLYLLSIVAASFVLSFLVIMAANDAFALCKESSECKVVLDSDTTPSKLARELRDVGVIEYPPVFTAYSALRGHEIFSSGEYKLSSDMSYDEIFAVLSGKTERTQIKITIPEGCTTDEIIDIFLKNGIGSREGFAAALELDYGYDYVPESVADRTYKYDGYLFPDTYFFYSDSSEEQAIKKLLRNFDVKFTNEMRRCCEECGISIDEAVTLASIIQGEAYYTAEMCAISSVFHNRLNSRGLRRLESDATVNYAWRVEEYDGNYLDIDSPYNSYKNAGLTPGAICSPGLSALEAAVKPKNTNYYYFFSKSDKTFVFSKTYSEHVSNLRKYGVRSERSK